jgi:hypothetical protein
LDEKAVGSAALPWYVPGALGERPTSAPRQRLALFAAAAALLTLGTGLTACGGDGADARQDADEPSGEFPVQVTEAKFPTPQRLAQTSDLILGVRNTGDETIPELSFTITTDDDDGDAGANASTDPDGPFSIRLDDESLSNPNRPVWVLENKFPRPVGDPPPPGLGPGFRAQTNTFAFGSLEPGETQEIIWRVTPVIPGTYTLRYQVEAGLTGKARAVTADGGEVKGEFIVTIDDKPPKATVDDAGKVVTEG